MALAFALPAALWLQADVPLLTSLRVTERSHFYSSCSLGGKEGASLPPRQAQPQLCAQLPLRQCSAGPAGILLTQLSVGSPNGLPSLEGAN